MANKLFYLRCTSIKILLPGTKGGIKAIGFVSRIQQQCSTLSLDTKDRWLVVMSFMELELVLTCTAMEGLPEWVGSAKEHADLTVFSWIR